MRVRSLASFFATSCLVATAALRCSVPPAPPGPAALSTPRFRPEIGMLDVPFGSTVDHAALVASLREVNFSVVILRASATEAGASIRERVALAVELQRELGDALVFVGTYEASAHDPSGTPMEDLLQKKDPSFDKCYGPDGPALGADLALVDKLRICSQDVAQKLADELTRVNASPQIGCYIAHQPELVDTLSNEAQGKLHDLLRDAAGPCAIAKRAVALSTVLSARAADPDRASVLLRTALTNTGIRYTILQDGVGSVDPATPDRARRYYGALRVALDDRPELPMRVWANVEAFDCDDAGCDHPHPTTSERYLKRLCAAQRRVEGISTTDYLRDLAGKSLVSAERDASADAQGIANDLDASAQLRKGFLEWSDAGAPCPPK